MMPSGDDASAEYTPMPLEWKLVEVVGLEAPLEPTAQMLTIDPDVKPMQANGLKGWAVAWVREEERYLIETFNGFHICISPHYLEEFEPPSVELGGFDLAFPAEGMPLEPFAAAVASKLGNQNFCVVQLSTSAAQSREAVRKAKFSSREWLCMPPEFEAMFMGRKPNGKVSWLTDDEGQASESAAGDPLMYADMMMEEVTLALSPYCTDFGFVAACKSNAMLRMPLRSLDLEDDLLYAEGGGQMTGEDLKSYADFMKRGKICLMYFLSGSGGSLILEPVDATKPSTEILVEEGQLVIFDQDLMSFSYAPLGYDALVMQSWILREALSGEVGGRGAYDDVTAYDTTAHPQAPKIGKSGETVDCMALNARFIGNINNGESCNVAFLGGLDGLKNVPIGRWDHQLYLCSYEKQVAGKTYVKHVGTLTDHDDVWAMFDNDFWGMTTKEASEHSPQARVLLDTVFQTCIRSGFTQETLRGTECAAAIGNAGSADLFGGLAVPEAGYTQEVVGRCTNSCNIPLLATFKLGIVGPLFVVDTACSSGLYATSLCHSVMRPQEPGKLRKQGCRQVRNGLAGSVQAYFTPDVTIAFSKAGMLSREGRSFTFDSSADGYARSEGCAVCQFQVHEKECLSRLCMLVGTSMNQDGRSSSLTAPNGVSQQLCIRQSLREAGVEGLDVQMQELHGIGTALGDSIEVGALRNIMMITDGVVRSHPLVQTSSKSSIGHMELVAGVGGIIKCILMGAGATASPGVHIRRLNAHIDDSRYPVLFVDECVDQGTNWGYSGVSSFGFSGCNARGDIWSMATAGHRKALPIGWDLSPMRHATMSRHITYDEFGPEKTLDVEDWDGSFQIGNPLGEWTQFHISGTWSKWASLEAPFAANDGVFEWAFRIGDTLTEEFRIHVDQYADYVLVPAMRQATSPDILILGPGAAPRGYTWKVDGRADGAKVGDMYVVKFWFDAQEKKKKISWNLAPADIVEELTIPKPSHRYYVYGSFTGWAFQEMNELEDFHETSLRLSYAAFEEFQFCRDRDFTQFIYPAITAPQSTDVAVRGPDIFGKNKYWKINGKQGQQVSVRLKIDAGKISVSIVSASSRDLTWTNYQEDLSAKYSVAFDDGRSIAMENDKENAAVYRAVVKTSDGHQQNLFRIVVDGDPDVAVYPEMDGAFSAQSRVLGPDNLAAADCPRWNMGDYPNETFTITLDFSQPERRSIVSWDVKTD